MAVVADDSQIIEGGFIPGTGAPSYSLKVPQSATLPVLIAAPHGGRSYPDDILAAMRDAPSALLRLEDRHIDRIAAAVAAQCNVPLIMARAPRAMLDLNRSRDDVDWGMVKGGQRSNGAHSIANRRSRSGLGLIPRRLSGSGEIWKQPIPSHDLDARIEGIHKPYHAALSRQLDRLRDEWGAVLLIDFHSMPPLRRKPGETAVARFVIGDLFGTSSDGNLAAAALRHLQGEGWPCNHNRPYSGGYVLERHSAPARGIHAMQVEICRSTYLDADLAEPASGAGQIIELMSGMVRQLGTITAQLAQRGSMAQAAE